MGGEGGHCDIELLRKVPLCRRSLRWLKSIVMEFLGKSMQCIKIDEKVESVMM